MPETPLPEAVVYTAASLDGFIARPDGSIDWLPTEPLPDGGDYGYADFVATIDTHVMGRNTFEQVLTFGAWPYAGKRFVVLSRGSVDVPEALQAQVEVLDLEPAALLAHLGATGTRRIYVDGGVTIQRFLRAGLIRELILTRIPVLLGSGIPLFGDVPQDIPLEHVQTRTFANGLVQSRYRIPATD